MKINSRALEDARNAKGYNQTFVAKKLGIPLSTYSIKERAGDFRDTQIKILCNILEISESDLYGEQKTQMSGQVNLANGDRDEVIKSKDQIIASNERLIRHLEEENKRLKDERDASSLELTKVVLVNTALLRTVLDCQALLRSKALKEPEKEALLQIDKLKAGHLRKIQEEHKIDL
jgi:transcriptional regulator with XRE-family HTH domain